MLVKMNLKHAIAFSLSLFCYVFAIAMFFYFPGVEAWTHSALHPFAALKPVVKTQLSAVANHEPSDHIENAATLGLLGMAVDSFSAGAASRSAQAPSTRVGQYLVTDLGTFSTVRTSDGHSYRCDVFSVPEEGGGIKCEPVR